MDNAGTKLKRYFYVKHTQNISLFGFVSVLHIAQSRGVNEQFVSHTRFEQ